MSRLLREGGPAKRRRGWRPLRFESLESRRMMAAFDVLVFSKTAGFRHDSIDEGVAAIQALGAANDFTVTHTENRRRLHRCQSRPIRSRRLPEHHGRRAQRGAANGV